MSVSWRAMRSKSAGDRWASHAPITATICGSAAGLARAWLLSAVALPGGLRTAHHHPLVAGRAFVLLNGSFEHGHGVAGGAILKNSQAAITVDLGSCEAALSRPRTGEGELPRQGLAHGAHGLGHALHPLFLHR